ncbi:hypothetical protein G6F24_017113 [Rhizopus arrhizus]|nr:hypothetical protein G6F24_017113 [Rhizopus arrhizus]
MFYLPGTSRGWGDAPRGGHGWTDLRQSIAESVNTYYYKLALDLGIERFDHYMEYYGFGQPTGIDLPVEIGGILPSPAYKRKTRKEAWYPGDTRAGRHDPPASGLAAGRLAAVVRRQQPSIWTAGGRGPAL